MSKRNIGHPALSAKVSSAKVSSAKASSSKASGAKGSSAKVSTARASSSKASKAKVSSAEVSRGKAAALAGLPDDELLEAVQRQTFRFFVEGSHPVSGLAPDRRTIVEEPVDDLIGIGGSGFGVMAHIVAVERGWMTREEAVDRIASMVDVLIRATCYHGVFPHFMNGRTGATIPFSRKDDGGDIVETSYLVMGLLCARQYFDRETQDEVRLRQRIGYIWGEVEWNWYTQGGRKLLYWHWSPNNGWVLDHEIRGWNECLITYVLAASSPRYPIDPVGLPSLLRVEPRLPQRQALLRHRAAARAAARRAALLRPLFASAASIRAASRIATPITASRIAATSPINRAHCIANPHGHKGYGEDCWGLTASDDPTGYDAHAPDNDNGTISPTAALASYPYAPKEAMRVMRHILDAARRQGLGPIRLRRCLQPIARLVRRDVPGDRSGPDHRDDRELSHRPPVEALHERA